VIVNVACICPETSNGVRHPEGDAVTLRERLGFRSAVTMQKVIATLRDEIEEPSSADILAALTEAYVVYGIESWTLVDARGKAIPVNRATIEEHLLSDLTAALAVADVADDLYQETVLLPLLMRGSASSVTTPTTESTSPETSSPDEPPTPSKPSSITTSPMGVIATTSPSLDGGSNSSQSSASAA
jgi:hypothetical protein